VASAGRSLFNLFHECRDAIAAGAAEEIHLFDGRQAFPQLLNHAPGRHARPPVTACRQFPQNLFRVARQLLICVLPQSTELLDQGIVRPCIDAACGKHGRLTSRALDFSLQPFEVLARRRRVGKDPDGLLHGDRPELLQPAPRPHTQIGGTRWQLVDQQQPATGPWFSACRSVGLGAPPLRGRCHRLTDVRAPFPV
jgi:hypothetical protein